MYGKKHKGKGENKLSNIDNPRYGVKLSEETKRAIAMKHSKKVYGALIHYKMNYR